MGSIYRLAECLALVTLANGVQTAQLSAAGQNLILLRAEGVSHKKKLNPAVSYFSTVAEGSFPSFQQTSTSESRTGEISRL